MAAIVANCRGLEALALAFNHIGAPGAGGGLPALRELDLTGNPLGRAAGHAQGELPALLRGCPRLAHLKLRRCELSGPALKAVLRECRGLESLELSRNAFERGMDGDGDMRAVAALVERAPRLAALDLSYTGEHTNGALRELSGAVGARPELRTLKMHGVDVFNLRLLLEAWGGRTRAGLELDGPARDMGA